MARPAGLGAAGLVGGRASGVRSLMRGRTARSLSWRRGWWVLLLGAVLGTVAGLLVGLGSRTADVSSSEILVTGPGARGSAELDTTSQYVNQRASTYALMVTSDEVLGPVGRDLGIATSELASEVSANVLGSTTVITIDVSGPSPENSRRVAEAVTASFVRAVALVETPIPGVAPRVATTVIRRPATPVVAPTDPWPIVGGAGAGLLLGVATIAVVGSDRTRQFARRVYAWMATESTDPPLWDLPGGRSPGTDRPGGPAAPGAGPDAPRPASVPPTVPRW